MHYVSSPLATPLLFLITASVWTMVLLYRFQPLRQLASLCVDKYRLRPSTIDALVIANMGISQIVFLFALPSPFLVFHLVVGLSGSVTVAIAAEVLRTQASEQVRPPWYVGEGKPDWVVRPRSVHNFRFSIFSGAAFITAVCVAAGIGVPRWKSHHSANAARIAATNLIVDLGGKVKQQNVVLAGTEATDEHLKQLAYLGRIRNLNLNVSGTNISNAGMKHFAHVAADLRILFLSRTNIDDAGLESLREATKLEMLVLGNTNVTGVGLRQEWARLKNVDLSQCPVTREGIERVAIFPELVFVSVRRTSVDDSMVDVLAKLQTKVLDISGTKITQEGFDRLKELASGIETIRWYEARPVPPQILHTGR